MSPKVVLIHPPHLNATDDRLDPPMGLLYIAAHLENNGIDVDVCDLSGYGIAFETGVWSYQRPLLTENIVPYADTYGITVYISSIDVTHEIIKICKHVNPKCTIVVGGAHPSICPDDFRDFANHVVVGQGEEAMLRIVQHTAGFWKVTGTEPKDPFIFPAYHKIDPHSYHRKLDGKTSLPYITSRGCPFQCFPKGTTVIVSKGGNKTIENIIVGDKLVAYDNGTLVETEVKELFKGNTNKLLNITFENGGILRCTQEHPFFVKERWVEASNLNIGDEVYSITFKDKMSFQKKLYNPAKDEKVKKKISNALKEKIFSGEIDNQLKIQWKNKNVQEIHPKFVNPEKWSEMCDNTSDRMKINNPMYVKETAEKVGKTLKKKYASGESVPYFSKTPKELWHMKYISSEEEWNDWKIRNSIRATLDNPMYKPHVNNLFDRKINGSEKTLLDILELNFPGRYKFTGYSEQIGWYYPDFTSIGNEKKLIELYGCYWHGCNECLPNNTKNKVDRDAKRIKNFEKFGYKTLEIWEHELKDLDTLVNKIGNFTYNGLKIISIEEERVDKDVYNFSCYPYENYFVSTNKHGDYVLSHNCSFCGLAGMHKLGNGVRMAEPETVYEHIKRIKSEFGIDRINFQDDIFTFNPKRLAKILKLITPLDIIYRCMGRAGYDTEDTYKMLADSGCTNIAWGIESGSQYILDRMKKQVKVEDNYNVIQWAKKYGITARAFFILGFPGETDETIEETKQFIEWSDPDQTFVSNFVPYPGTKVASCPERYGITNMSGNYDDFYQVSKDGTGGMTIDTEWLSRSELRKLELEFRAWLHKRHMRGSLQDYEIEMEAE